MATKRQVPIPYDPGVEPWKAEPFKTKRVEYNPEMNSWRAARARCSESNHRDWHRYGGRGIRMCPEWLNDFQAFLDHVGPRPGPGYTLDRINNDRGYEPGNVRWATHLEQARNRAPRRAWKLTEEHKRP